MVTTRKLAHGLFALNRAKNVVPQPVLRSLYFTLIYTHLEYGCVPWGSAHTNDIQKLIVMQNKAVRIINHQTYIVPSNNLILIQDK